MASYAASEWMRLTGNQGHTHNELPFEHPLLWVCVIAPFARLIDRYKNEDGSHKNPSICMFRVQKEIIQITFTDRNKIVGIKSISVWLLSQLLTSFAICQNSVIELVVGLHVCPKICFQKCFRKHLRICSWLHLIWCLSMIIDTATECDV